MPGHVGSSDEKGEPGGCPLGGGVCRRPPLSVFLGEGLPPYRTTTLAFASNGFFRIARLNRYG